MAGPPPSDWARRKEAAGAVLDRAERAGRKARAAADRADGRRGAAASVTPTMPVAELRARLAALQPQPWPSDRAAAAAAVRAASGTRRRRRRSSICAGRADRRCRICPLRRRRCASIGPVTEICCDTASAALLLPPTSEADRLVVHLAQAPRPIADRQRPVLAQSGDGRTLARTAAHRPGGAAAAAAKIVLPPELRNRLDRLVLEGPPSAGSVVLLDERWRRRPVGLLAGDLSTADTPFAGPLYFVRRALEPFAELREGDLTTLLKRDISVLILADRPLPDGRGAGRAGRDWVQKGGLLIRFAGPRTAEAAGNDTDTLLPVKLLAGDRQLGGAMSWSQPAGLAPFPPDSPFAGLAVPDEVQVTARCWLSRPRDLATPYLGALGRRHAAGDRGAAGARAASCCSMSPPTPTGPTCRSPACSSTCCAAWWRCPPAWPAAQGDDHARAGSDAGRVRPADAAAAGARRRCAADEFAPHAGFAAASAGPLWPGKRAAGAEPGHQLARPGGAPPIAGATLETIGRFGAGTRARTAGCWRRRSCCWRSIC